MRYHYEKPTIYVPIYGETYICDHPVYDRCTLFKIDDKGLAVIQQRYNPSKKCTWWGEVDPWLPNELYIHPKFKQFFDKRAGTCTDGLYPTVTIRQIMWALKMKPLPKERWETVEKAIVLYERGNKFEKAYVQTLAGEQIVVSKVLIGDKYFEIMVFKTDGRGRVLDYNQYEEYNIKDSAEAKQHFEEIVEKWSNETRTLIEIKPDHIVCE